MMPVVIECPCASRRDKKEKQGFSPLFTPITIEWVVPIFFVNLASQVITEQDAKPE
jgi:hypothetical protein